METLFHSSPIFGFKLKKAPLKIKQTSLQIFAFSYQKFIQFALQETQKHVHLVPSPSQEKYSVMKSMDGKAELEMKSFNAPKIRYLRSLSIQSSDEMQVLDFAVFPEPEFDLPIFCANFFTAGNMNIIVMDLNPLHDVIVQKDYKEKYYKRLMPLGLKYVEVRTFFIVLSLQPLDQLCRIKRFLQILPWGGKLTSESLRFFSPIVIWTKFTSSQHNHEILFSAFVDYYKAWLELMNQAVAQENASQVLLNCEAQHKYLTWRTEKDPGHQVLKRLVGETASKELVRNFLFSGIDTLGSKTFLDYFPEYRCEDGTINQKRSVIGKSFKSRPWDTGGEFIGNKISLDD